MSNLNTETIQEMAEMRREAGEDLTDLVFLINIASVKLKTLGDQYSYLGTDFHDLTTAIRIAKEKAEIARDYHNSEAFQLEKDVNKALEKLQATGPLLKEQERDSNG